MIWDAVRHNPWENTGQAAQSARINNDQIAKAEINPLEQARKNFNLKTRDINARLNEIKEELEPYFIKNNNEVWLKVKVSYHSVDPNTGQMNYGTSYDTETTSDFIKRTYNDLINERKVLEQIKELILLTNMPFKLNGNDKNYNEKVKSGIKNYEANLKIYVDNYKFASLKIQELNKYPPLRIIQNGHSYVVNYGESGYTEEWNRQYDFWNRDYNSWYKKFNDSYKLTNINSNISKCADLISFVRKENLSNQSLGKNTNLGSVIIDLKIYFEQIRDLWSSVRNGN